MSTAPIVIGHRGAAGWVPEHTLLSYFIAAQFGADFVEPDLVMTKDGVLVARHENEIGGTTNVAAHPEFANRKARKSIDGTEIEGWFTEDFTLAELKTLRARERIPEVRPANTRFDGKFEVPTLEEILSLVRGLDAQKATRAQQLGLPAPPKIGVYPETKHPSYFKAHNLPMEKVLVETLARYGYQGKDAPIWLQSFEVGNLIELARLTQLRRMQLIDEEGAPFDFVLAKDPRTYAQLITPPGLEGIARYAQAIGPSKIQIIPRRADGTLGEPTRLVADAHAHGLQLHPWTFRAENKFLPRELRRGSSESDFGDLEGEIIAHLKAGIDGFFTDQADIGVAARAAFLARRASPRL